MTSLVPLKVVLANDADDFAEFDRVPDESDEEESDIEINDGSNQFENNIDETPSNGKSKPN